MNNGQLHPNEPLRIKARQDRQTVDDAFQQGQGKGESLPTKLIRKTLPSRGKSGRMKHKVAR